MFGLFQSTPQYVGNGQPTASRNGGALGFLSGLLAFPTTPPYATARSEQVTTAAPAAAPATTEPTMSEPVASEQATAQPDCRVPLPVAIVIQRSE